MFIHSKKLNNCNCGSKSLPILDSDDFVPCWNVTCENCHKIYHSEDWSLNGAVRVWNENNLKNKEDENKYK